MGDWMSYAWIFGTFVICYFVLIRPQKKREKKDREMRSALVVGDYITTFGGICGRIISIKDDSISIETGADRTKVQIKKWAIQGKDPAHEEKTEA